MSLATGTSHQAVMDRIYRHQRHIYDLTRKYYLLERDRLIDELVPPPGGRVLEIGCGTGRNLVKVAQRYPGAKLYGVDISEEMLLSATESIERAGLVGQIKLAHADAVITDPRLPFRVDGFDRIYFSYTLSMIPGWQGALEQAVAALAPGGRLHIVDFGTQDDQPFWFRRMLLTWLSLFHVEPRAQDLPKVMKRLAKQYGSQVEVQTLKRSYVILASLKRDLKAG